MSNTAVRQVIETVGLIGVVGSLIFVGLEVRQNSISTRAATNAAVAETFMQVNVLMASNPQLITAWVNNAENPEAASPADAMLVLAMMRSLFHVWSNAHRQYLNGTLDPAIYEALVNELEAYKSVASGDEANEFAISGGRYVRWAWKSQRFIFNRDFQSFMDAILGVEG